MENVVDNELEKMKKNKNNNKTKKKKRSRPVYKIPPSKKRGKQKARN